MDAKERAQLQAYMRARFKTPNLEVRERPRKKDSAEVYIDNEFVGVFSRDDEEGELSWHFTMSVLEEDLADQES